MSAFFGVTTVIFGVFLIGILYVNERELFSALIVGYVLRAIFAITYQSTSFLSFWGDNLYPFEAVGWRWSKEGLMGLFPHFTTGPDFYSWLISAFYIPMPRSNLAIVGINVILSTLIIRECYLIAYEIGGQKSAKRAAWLSAIFPTLILFSGIAAREVFIQLFIAKGTKNILKWHNSNYIIYFVLSFLCLVFASAFHGAILALVFFLPFYILIRSVIEIFRRIRYRSITSTNIISYLIGTVCASLFVVIFFEGWGGKITRLTGNPDSLVQVVEQGMEGRAKGRAAYGGNVEVNSLIDVPLSLITRVPNFLFGPFPWLISKLRDFMGSIDGLIYFYMVMRIVIHARKSLFNPKYLYIIIILTAFVFVFSQVSNYGTAFRHRAKVVSLLIALVSVFPFPVYVKKDMNIVFN